jgi:hypothetical protein
MTPTPAFPLLLAALAPAVLAGPSRAQCQPDIDRVSFTGPIGDTLEFANVADMNAAGDLVAFGSPSDTTVAAFAGAVRIWRHDGAAWIPTPPVAPAFLQANDSFGRSLAVDAVGDTLLVGAPRPPLAGDEGRAYVLQFDGTTWNVEATLVASDATSHSAFGQTCDLDASGTLCVVASKGGGAYVFRRVGVTWIEEQVLDPGPVQYVALSPDGGRIGYRDRVYRHDGAQWVLESTLVASGGHAVVARAFDAGGSLLLADAIGASGEPTVFRRGPSGWSEEQELPVPQGLVNLTGQLALDAFGEVAYVRGMLSDGSAWAVAPFRFDGSAWTAGELLVATVAGEGLAGAIAVGADAGTFAFGAGIPDPRVAGFYSFRCASPSAFCRGTVCPCGNTGLIGRGCDNAAATGGVRLAAGAFDAQAGTAELVASGAPASTSPTALLLRASTASPGLPFLDGRTCLDGALTRVAARVASGGDARFAIVHDDGAGTFHYQVLYRSEPAGFCTAGAANLSSGLTLIWR